MPDPGDTAKGDKGQGAGWSKSPSSSSSSGTGPRGPESSWGTRGGASGGSLSGGQLSNYGGGGNKTGLGGSNSGGSGPRGPQSSWGTRGSPTGGALSGSQLSNPYGRGGGGNVGGALSAGLGGNYSNPAVSNPISMSSQVDDGLYSRLSPNSLSLPGMESPTQFDNRIYQSNFVNRYGNPMETWSKGYDPNRLTAGAQKLHQAVMDNAFRTGTPVDYFSGKRAYNSKTGTTQHSLGQALDIRINDPVTGLPVGYDQIGEAAYNPIASVRKDKYGNYIRSPAQAARIEGALAEPYREFASGVIGGFYNNPGVYGDFNNQRWGGAFETGEFSKDYMHFDEGKAASGVSASQSELRQMAQATRPPSGPLSSPAATEPVRVAQAGMGVLGSLFGTAAPAEPSAELPDQPINAPYSNLFDKTDRLDVATNTVPSWQQSTYTGPAPQAVPGSTVANTVPSWQQSTYTGPIETVMNVPDPIQPASVPQVDIPYPVPKDEFGYKIWRAGTYLGDTLLPGSGTLLRAMDDDLRERWPTMSNEERQALIDKWDNQNRPGVSNSSYVTVGNYEPKKGGDGFMPNWQNNQGGGQQGQTINGSGNPASEPSSATWKQDALDYGFTAEQLKDPEIAAYIKQLWEMGWIPKTANA